VEGQRADGRVSISYPLFTELQEQQTVLTGLMADAGAGLERVELEGQKLSGVRVSSVSGNYFEVLGVRPYLGRMLSAEDDQPGGEGGAAVVSYAFWTGRLGGQSDALGRVLRVGGSHFTIAGVAPPEFFGAQVGSRTDVWLPMRRSMSEDSLTWRTGTFFRIMGRLGSGVTPQQAEQELSALFRHRLEAEAAQGETIVRQGTRIADHRILLKPAANGFDRLRQSYSLPLKVLTAATLLALLIVCFNVANLMLARAAARGRELATRLALGAGRLRLARQMMMESLLLGLVGGLAGLVTAWAASPFIAGFIASPQDASLLHLRPDGRILGYALAASLATGLLFGLAPVCWCLLRDPGRALGGGREGSDSGRPRLRLAKVMMAAQLTISLLLLSGAGLMLGTLQELAGVSLGFQQERLAVASVHFEVPRERRTELTRAIEERLAAEPGVRSASASWLGLFTRSNMSANLDIAGYQAGADEEVSVRVNSVSPAYLDTLGIPLLAGRPLRASDDEGAPKAALVNRAFVQRYLPGQSALGRTFRLKGDDADVEIVGVTGDFLWNDLRARPEPIFLLSSAQWGMSTRSIQIRLQVPFQSAAASLRKAIEDLDETALVVRLESMSNQVDTTIRQERMLAHLAAWFSGLGTLLACLGLYGILSYSVQRRRREIGIRLAVGARRSAILGLVLREALLLLLVALPLGLAGSWLASQAISSFLFGVEPHDPRILTGVAALLALVTLLAALLPARRAAALDPAHILRE
ncbi:MAG TPA: ADOP family duplicated permease, partial [Acidobacteriota bacterium]|nr:ADOP family duplicated permease [Acidobacteriota bacterium]